MYLISFNSTSISEHISPEFLPRTRYCEKCQVGNRIPDNLMEETVPLNIIIKENQETDRNFKKIKRFRIVF